MRNFSAIMLAAAVFAIPGAAHANGYVQVQAGLDAVKALGSTDEGVAYGIAAGYDFPLSESMFAGLEVSADDSSTKDCDFGFCIKTGRDLSAVARIGAKVSARSEVYALAGYSNARYTATGFGGDNLDGIRAGAGYKMNFGEKLFGKLEYRYTNYEQGVSRHNGLVAVGLNF